MLKNAFLTLASAFKSKKTDFRVGGAFENLTATFVEYAEPLKYRQCVVDIGGFKNSIHHVCPDGEVFRRGDKIELKDIRFLFHAGTNGKYTHKETDRAIIWFGRHNQSAVVPLSALTPKIPEAP